MSNKKTGTSDRTKPTERDFACLTMALKDEADLTKKLYHPKKK